MVRYKPAGYLSPCMGHRVFHAQSQLAMATALATLSDQSFEGSGPLHVVESPTESFTGEPVPDAL